MTEPSTATQQTLLRRGVNLERVTLVWNVVGIVVLGIAAVKARSVALAGFGLDSLIEIGASTVVLRELSGTGEHARSGRYADRCSLRGAGRVHHGAIHLGVGDRPPRPAQLARYRLDRHHGRRDVRPGGGKARTGAALGNPVLQTEGRVTFVDGLLATAVLVGLAFNALVGAWWADPLAGFVIVFYGLREAYAIFFGDDH